METTIWDSPNWIDALCDSSSRHLIAGVVVASTSLVYPYWEAANIDDDKMKFAVDAMRQWFFSRSEQSTVSLTSATRLITGKPKYDIYRELSLPDSPDVIGSDSPADFAGDSIVWGANALVCFDESERLRLFSRRSLEFAVEAISRLMEEREAVADRDDTWSHASLAHRDAIYRHMSERKATGG